MNEEIIDLAKTIPAWKVVERFYPGVEATSTQAGPEAPEVVTWPDGFKAPSPEAIFAHKLHLAGEFLATSYQRGRAEAFAARPIGDQLDAIIKGLKAVAASGTDLPADTAQLIAWSDQIKVDNPKPAEA